jgi:hypothetical protein
MPVPASNTCIHRVLGLLLTLTTSCLPRASKQSLDKNYPSFFTRQSRQLQGSGCLFSVYTRVSNYGPWSSHFCSFYPAFVSRLHIWSSYNLLLVLIQVNTTKNILCKYQYQLCKNIEQNAFGDMYSQTIIWWLIPRWHDGIIIFWSKTILN